MGPVQESPGTYRARWLFVAVLSLVLIGLAHGAAEVAAYLGGEPADPLRARFALWAAVLLVTPALGFYLLKRPGTSGGYWRPFWTFAYLAYVCHFLWSFVAPFDVALFGTGRAAVYPALAALLALWWGLDVALPAPGSKAVEVPRGAVHFFAFAFLFGTTFLAPSAGPVDRLLGVLLALVVLSCSALRLLLRESDPTSLLTALYIKAFQVLNAFVPWHRLPTFLAAVNLGAFREVLRARNLHNTSDLPVTRPEGVRPTPPFEPAFAAEREPDGFYNDLSKPAMGSASLNPADPLDSSEFTHSIPGARFGRNIPLADADPRQHPPLDRPSARTVSNRLLARPGNGFVPARTLNLLAAAWIQFQTHDWFNHLVPIDPTGVERTGLSANWWLGLSLLHNLFTLEHNAICDRLKRAYPAWDDEQLFRTARLVNVALMAKIHTVDWTPAILGHPALDVGADIVGVGHGEPITAGGAELVRSLLNRPIGY
jgi:hypothetical protein